MSTEPENNQTATDVEKAVEAAASKPATSVQQQSKTKAAPLIDEGRVAADQKRKTNVPGILFNLLFVGGLCFLAFMFFEQKKAIDVVFTQQNQFAQVGVSTASDLLVLQTQTQRLDTLLADAGNRIEAQDIRLTEANSLITSQSSEVENLNRELIRTRLKINDSGTAVNQEWLLAEAESLLRLAQQGLIVTGDVRAAIALFIASDDILKEINDPAIFSIRDTLAIELRALRAVPEIDTQGIYLELGELARQIENLQVISGEEESFNFAPERTIHDESTEGDTGIMDAVLSKLSEYIVVSRRDEAIQPLLTSEQKHYVMQNIQLQIEQARLALLREQEAVFASSLEGVRENIQRYLMGNSSNKQNILLGLKTLQDSDIIVKVPPVTSTLNALRTIIPENNEQREGVQEMMLPSTEVINITAEPVSGNVNEQQVTEEL